MLLLGTVRNKSSKRKIIIKRELDKITCSLKNNENWQYVY